MNCNRLELCGEVVQLEVLRYTPAGIPLLSFILHHLSDQVEAGMGRRVECDVPALIMGELAQQSSHVSTGTKVQVSGFLARRSLKSTQLVLHIDTLKII